MNKREEIIEKVADIRTEEADIKVLSQYFYEGQIDFLENMSDKELEDHLNEYGLEWVLKNE